MELKTYIELYGIAERIYGFSDKVGDDTDSTVLALYASNIYKVINDDLPWELRREEKKDAEA